MKYIKTHEFWMLIILLVILCSCSKPFMVGKTHQLRWGTPPKTKTIVKVIQLKQYEKYVSIVFVKDGDTLSYNHLTQKQFNKMFKLIK